MTQELARVDYKPTDLDTQTLGRVLVKSGFFRDTRDEAQAIVKVLAGRELGFGPIASMRGIDFIDGQISPDAGLIAAMVQRSGKYAYRVRETTDKKCRIEFFERGESLGISEFTIDDATRAKLQAKDNWTKYPKAMLWARAMSQGARSYCPEIFSGAVSTPDELEKSPMPQPKTLEVDHDTGEITSEEGERDVAIQAWVEASEEATRLGISHKDLPNNPSVELIQRWTKALEGRIYQTQPAA